MPRGDRTGPNGSGPKTGRALGYCAGNEIVANQDGRDRSFGGGFGHRRGFGDGQGFGGGFGHRRGFGNGQGRAAFTGVSEKTLVQNEINILKDQLVSLEERLKNL